MTAIVGTAGHIDHGKTTLLRALTGIDADRLPESRRRGMTIDVGYAHLVQPDGTMVDFVDVPGHNRLVGNMLVGAGEIDAVMLVVAADDGPSAQTREHLALLDGLGIHEGMVVITKADLVDADRLARVRVLVAELLAPTGLAGVPTLVVSSTTGEGLEALGSALVEMVRRVEGDPPSGGPVRLAVDRSFAVRGRGAVVTGSLRGGPLASGALLRVVPGDREVRVREVQVHGRRVALTGPGRTALNLAGMEPAEVARGAVVTGDARVVATDRLLAVLHAPRLPGPGRRAPVWPPRDGVRARLHLGTADAEAALGRAGHDALLLPDGRAIAIVRIGEPVAAAPGDPFVLRRAGPGTLLAGGVVLDPRPARGVSRRRQTPVRVAALASALASRDDMAARRARLDLHGALADENRVMLADDVREAGIGALVGAVGTWHEQHPGDAGMPLTAGRTAAARSLRRAVMLQPGVMVRAADAVITDAVAARALIRDGDRLRLRDHRAAGPEPALLAAMDRLEAALAGSAPPPLAATAAAVGCPPEGIVALERAGRIVGLGPDLAWAAATYRALAARALLMARRGPLTPAAYRDATGTSRRYSLAILEDLDRRGILRRTDAGHVPGPKAPPLP